MMTRHEMAREAALGFAFGIGFWLVMILGAYLFLGFVITITPAHSRPNEQWAQSDSEIAKWYRDLKQPDFPRSSCCGEADAYWSDSFERDEAGDLVAIITDDREIAGRPGRNGERITIPAHKYKWDEGNPTGHGVVFISPNGQLYCYIAPGGV